MEIAVREIRAGDRMGISEFLALPRRIYSRDSPWVAPLLTEQRRKFNPTSNPFFKYGNVQLFVANNADEHPVGRIAAIFNPHHQEVHGQPAGFFGSFECTNDVTVARQLFDRVQEALSRQGCDEILGPVNLTTNDESGFLIEGYGERPTFMCNYCPGYYHELVRACGFEKAVDTLSFMAWHGHPFPDKYYRLIKRFEANPRLRIKRFDKKSAKDDILTIAGIYNESFHDTWGFVPMSDEEAMELGRGLVPIADPDLVWIAFCDDRPAGAILGFPDINEILAHLNGRLLPFGFLRFLFGQRRIQGMRVAALGVTPECRSLGIETLLIHKVHQRVHTRPYQRSEFSVVMENNHRMRNLLERFGFTCTRRYRLYRKRM